MFENLTFQPQSAQTGENAVEGGEGFLAFHLGEEEYGVAILKVQEIRGLDTITRIANAPPFVKGVINLRGVIVPIVDMRVRFGLDDSPERLAVVIILSLSGRVVGMVVDSVSDVVSLLAHDIRPAPQLGAALDTRFLRGIATLEERMLLLLDIEKLILSAELGLTEPEPVAV